MNKRVVGGPCPPTCSPFTQAVLQYASPATHRFFNTKPFDYTIHNREVCSCPCETSPTQEPYFLCDMNGRLLAPRCGKKRRPFPWSKYLRDQSTNCERQHCPANTKHIPHFFTKSNPRKKQSALICNGQATKPHDTKNEEVGEPVGKPTQACKCSDHISNKMNTDPMLLDIDPALTPIQRQLEIGLRKLRKYQPPVIWILGHPHVTTTQQREHFARSLANTLDYTYINVDTEIWNRTQASPEDLTATNEDYIQTGDVVGKSAHSRLVLMSWKLTSNPSITLNEDGVLEMIRLVLIRYHKANGFVIDSYPCNEAEATGFEAMFYPATFAIYISPAGGTASRSRKKKAKHSYVKKIVPTHIEESKGHKASHEYDRGSIIEPHNFRRCHSYHEMEVAAIDKKYKHQLRALILDHLMDLQETEVELAAALILEEVSRRAKEMLEFLTTHQPPPNYYDMMIPHPACYNPYCDCHIEEDKSKNPTLQRDEQAMARIIQDIRAGQESFHPSLLDVLQKRGNMRDSTEEDENYQDDDEEEDDDNDVRTQGESLTTLLTGLSGEESFFRFHEVKSDLVGHGHHSDHHALRDTCSNPVEATKYPAEKNTESVQVIYSHKEGGQPSKLDEGEDDDDFLEEEESEYQEISNEDEEEEFSGDGEDSEDDENQEDDLQEDDDDDDEQNPHHGEERQRTLGGGDGGNVQRQRSL